MKPPTGAQSSGRREEEEGGGQRAEGGNKRPDAHLLRAGWPGGRGLQGPRRVEDVRASYEGRPLRRLSGRRGGAVARGISLSTLRAANSESGTLWPACLGAKRALKVLH